MWTFRAICVLAMGVLPSWADEPSGKDVRDAVARAVKWLREEQAPGGAFGSQPGETALAAQRSSAL